MSEFYVGWSEEPPPGLKRHQRWSASILVLFALGSSMIVGASQEVLPQAVFEFGAPRSFTGLVVRDPYPSLLVPRPNSEPGEVSRYLMVAPFKFGADELVAEYEGEWVSLEATLAYRDHKAVLEVVPNSLERVAALANWALETDLRIESVGEFTVEGEIGEAKCHHGVMVPGEGVPHRGCTNHCLLGGIPPVLLGTDEAGLPVRFLLVGNDGRAIGRELVGMGGRRVAVTGQAQRRGDWMYLATEPSVVRILDR